MSDVLSFAEVDGQYVELLPARTVLTTSSWGDGSDVFDGGDGGKGADGGDGNEGGDGKGGDGGIAVASADKNYNEGYYQDNYASASADGGDGKGGGVDADGGDGGAGGDGLDYGVK